MSSVRNCRPRRPSPARPRLPGGQPPVESWVARRMFSLQINGQDAENISTMDAPYGNHITVTRGSVHSDLFDDWINAAISNGPNAGRNFAVTTFDGNNQQMNRWEFTDAWIYKVVGESISIIFSRMEIV
ncbi:phage tail protein [Streptomyces sp. NPDC058000]|uniref:phage tail protein n=1 Tax=Streptomyces sp. NPDC058000 TaxID=3346299 RepID=UPI0036EBCAFA